MNTLRYPLLFVLGFVAAWLADDLAGLLWRTVARVHVWQDSRRRHRAMPYPDPPVGCLPGCGCAECTERLAAPVEWERALITGPPPALVLVPNPYAECDTRHEHVDDSHRAQDCGWLAPSGPGSLDWLTYPNDWPDPAA